MNRQEIAEILALRVLGWMLSREEMFDAFVNASGASRDDLGRLARDPVFLGALLDFILESDERVIACCDDLAEPYTAIATARAALPGGELPHWT